MNEIRPIGLALSANVRPKEENSSARFAEDRPEVHDPRMRGHGHDHQATRGRKARPNDATEREKTGHAHATGDDAISLEEIGRTIPRDGEKTRMEPTKGGTLRDLPGGTGMLDKVYRIADPPGPHFILGGLHEKHKGLSTLPRFFRQAPGPSSLSKTDHRFNQA
jgi:hypothetical protein